MSISGANKAGQIGVAAHEAFVPANDCFCIALIKLVGFGLDS